MSSFLLSADGEDGEDHLQDPEQQMLILLEERAVASHKEPLSIIQIGHLKRMWSLLTFSEWKDSSSSSAVEQKLLTVLKDRSELPKPSFTPFQQKAYDAQVPRVLNILMLSRPTVFVESVDHLTKQDSPSTE